MSLDEDQAVICVGCGRALGPGDAYVILEVEWGNGTGAHDYDDFMFCSQEHAAAYLSSTPLPEPDEYETPTGDGTKWSRWSLAGIRGAGLTLFWGLMVLANLGFYVLGLVTWLRWIWQD